MVALLQFVVYVRAVIVITRPGPPKSLATPLRIATHTSTLKVEV
jgi:hypothetical protein